MTLSALVVVLSDPDAPPPAAVTAFDGLTLGDPAPGGRVPAVLETDDADAGDRAVRDLSTREGVAHVEVVFVDLEPPTPPSTPPPVPTCPGSSHADSRP